MKRLMIISVMCLMAVSYIEAQVQTAATVKASYEEVALGGQSDLVYNAEFDGEAIKAMYVYQSFTNKKGNTSLTPSVQYQFTYAKDGLLQSRTVLYWCRGQWQTAARYDYGLQSDCYVIKYSRRNVWSEDFDKPCSMMVYSISPDKSVNSVACYSLNSIKDSYQMTAKVELDSVPPFIDNYLTQFGK